MKVFPASYGCGQIGHGILQSISFREKFCPSRRAQVQHPLNLGQKENCQIHFWPLFWLILSYFCPHFPGGFPSMILELALYFMDKYTCPCLSGGLQAEIQFRWDIFQRAPRITWLLWCEKQQKWQQPVGPKLHRWRKFIVGFRMGIEEGASAQDDDESTFTICDQTQKFCLGFIFCDALSNVHILLLIPKPAFRKKKKIHLLLRYTALALTDVRADKCRISRCQADFLIFHRLLLLHFWGQIWE